MNIMVSWCSFNNRIVQILKSIMAASQEGCFWLQRKGCVMLKKCKVMDKCTILRAADNGTAIRHQGCFNWKSVRIGSDVLASPFYSFLTTRPKFIMVTHRVITSCMDKNSVGPDFIIWKSQDKFWHHYLTILTTLSIDILSNGRVLTLSTNILSLGRVLTLSTDILTYGSVYTLPTNIFSFGWVCSGGDGGDNPWTLNSESYRFFSK